MPLSCGLGLSGEGSVVSSLILDRGDHAQGRVQAAVVVPVDPAGGGVLDVGDGLEGSVVEDGGADALGSGKIDSTAWPSARTLSMKPMIIGVGVEFPREECRRCLQHGDVFTRMATF